MNLLIVGASAGLGRALAEEAARRGHAVLLVSSDARDTAALAAHLRLQYGIEAASAGGDVGVPEQRERLAALALSWRPLDAVLLPIGLSRDDDTGNLDDEQTARLLDVNFLSQVCLVRDLWPHLLTRPGASVAGFGSIAAIRGRRRNIVYAAAKRALTSYFESLRALSADSGVSIQYYTIGYMDTQQTFGKSPLLPVVPPAAVARRVLDRLGTAHNSIYYPRWWRLVAIVLRLLPWVIYRRLRF